MINAAGVDGTRDLMVLLIAAANNRVGEIWLRL
jgi:hypothetical protein